MPPLPNSQKFHEPTPDVEIGVQPNHPFPIINPRSTDESRSTVFTAEERDTCNLPAQLNFDDELEFSHRHWEFTEGQNLFIKCSLKANIVFWEEILKPSCFVLNVLRHGYLLPFTQLPPRFYAKTISPLFGTQIL